jgi:DNA-binding Xre family transcriptional regulator
MKSNIRQLAIDQNMQTPQALSYELKMSWPTAKQLWDGNISKMRLGTMLKVAKLFNCKVDDLFEQL